jgi:methylated-DNA-protein-cysteine methyltransferase-like protein
MILHLSYIAPPPSRASDNLSRVAPKTSQAELAIRRAIAMIPRGKVATYGQVAATAGYPRGHRQVAAVLRKGGAPLPWYRVLGAGGQIKTSRDSALEQRMRLEMEGVAFRGARVDMAKHQSPLHINPRR